MKIPHPLTLACFALALNLILLAPAPAAVLVDIGEGNGSPTEPDTNGNYWTTVADFTANALQATDGTASGWSLQITSGTGSGFTGGGLDVIAEGAPADFAILGAYDDGYFDNTFTGFSTFAFTGLDAGTTYSLTLWGSRRTTTGGAAGQDADITIATGSATGGSSFLLEMATPLTLNITPDGSGNFAFTFDKVSGGGITGLNVIGLTATAIPEPASGSLLALGGLAIAWLRRRRA